MEIHSYWHCRNRGKTKLKYLSPSGSVILVISHQPNDCLSAIVWVCFFNLFVVFRLDCVKVWLRRKSLSHANFLVESRKKDVWTEFWAKFISKFLLSLFTLHSVFYEFSNFPPLWARWKQQHLPFTACVCASLLRINRPCMEFVMSTAQKSKRRERDDETFNERTYLLVVS